MSPEKTAVLVVTGVVAVLLALTLVRSRSDGEEPVPAAHGYGAEPPPAERPPRTRFVHIKSGPLEAPEHVGRPLRVGRVPSSSSSYAIRAGDTLGGIAQCFYGSAALAGLLMEANPGLDPRRLTVGDVIVVPAAPSQGGGAEQDPLPGKSSPGWHVVRAGERLETIAREHYGRGSAWKRIYTANRDTLRDPDHIREGMRLRLP